MGEVRYAPFHLKELTGSYTSHHFTSLGQNLILWQHAFAEKAGKLVCCSGKTHTLIKKKKVFLGKQSSRQKLYLYGRMRK